MLLCTDDYVYAYVHVSMTGNRCMVSDKTFQCVCVMWYKHTYLSMLRILRNERKCCIKIILTEVYELMLSSYLSNLKVSYPHVTM